MKDWSLVIIGALIGFLFGMSGIATLFDLMSVAITQTADQLTQLNTMSTVVLLVIAIILIVKIKIISSLVVGAIVGVVFNIILRANNIELVSKVGTALLQMLK
ncbi:MAG: hypothetical protein ACOCSC_03560 [Candidatus Hadarchaeota archaeon]